MEETATNFVQALRKGAEHLHLSNRRGRGRRIMFDDEEWQDGYGTTKLDLLSVKIARTEKEEKPERKSDRREPTDILPVVPLSVNHKHGAIFRSLAPQQQSRIKTAWKTRKLQFNCLVCDMQHNIFQKLRETQ